MGVAPFIKGCVFYCILYIYTCVCVCCIHIYPQIFIERDMYVYCNIHNTHYPINVCSMPSNSIKYAPMACTEQCVLVLRENLISVLLSSVKE